MADWKKRAHFSGDVVFFDYVTSRLEKNSGLVFVWDIDKTYLDTHFESLKGLLRTAMEKAFQKKNIPGTGSLVRALISSRGESEIPFPLYFISASPPQMERKIRGKLEIDGVIPYGAYFKDNLRNLKPKRLWRLNKQLGFKLQALMELRKRLKDDVKQIFWGDDSENDADVYNLYSDICARRIDESELLNVLEYFSVEDRQRDYILSLRDEIPNHDPVKRIYINLANDTDPDFYTKFGRRTLATYDTFQAALDLFRYEFIGDVEVVKVGQDMIMNYGFTQDEIAQSFEELLDREVIGKAVADELLPTLRHHGLVPSNFEPLTKDTSDSILELHKPEIWLPEFVDYVNDFR